MIRRIGLTNFKCFEKAEIELGRITILIGPNGSWKSTLMHALLLKQSSGNADLVLNGPYVKLGCCEDVVFRRDLSRGMEVKLEIQTRILDLRKLGYDENVEASYSISFRCPSRGSEISPVDHISYELTLTTTYVGHKVKIRRVDSEVEPKKIGLGDSECELATGTNVRPVLFHFAPADVKEAIEIVVANELGRLRYVYVLRGFVEPKCDLGDAPAVELNLSSPSSAQEVATTFAYKSELKMKVSEALRRILGRAVDFKFEPGKKVSLRARLERDALDVNAANEGFGFRQLVSLLAQLYSAPGGSMIMIEEPEIHLHPRAQSRLVDILIDVALREDKQLLISTHSEHVLMRALTSVAKCLLRPDDLVVYYFNYDEERGMCREPEMLRVDERGRLDKGLKGFFEHELHELEEYIKCLRGA